MGTLVKSKCIVQSQPAASDDSDRFTDDKLLRVRAATGELAEL